MGKRGRKRVEQQQLAAVHPEPKFPMETWSVEMPFDSSEFMKRVAVPTYEDDEPEPEAPGDE